MNGVSERDAIFLNEMGLAPLWQLRTAAAVEEAAAPPPAAARGPSPLQPVAQSASALAPVAAPPAAPPAPVAPPARPVGPAQPRPPGPSPLQPVAQSVSALAPVDVDSAWDDAALPSAATPEEIAVMDWDQLAIAIAACRRCSACREGRAPVPGTGAKQARWLVAAGATTAADDKARVPLAGDPGKLLDNMLAAVGMGRERDVYVTNLIKCRPTTPNGGERAPTPQEAAACRPYLEREVALTGAGTVLTLGQIAANTLLGRPLPEPLAGARGDVHALDAGGRAVDLVATLHPGELLRRGADKALAWADLCRARHARARSD
ncbi:uracil-DNA glycosylase family protein [Massilia sp. Root335]|uniref:uracil-DNA glycosylase n=1 Tax=Massilia sp. Root335 TaxID=1736517 RepID=UPI0006FC69F9|nr:uracil-DNA glycosylase [Massilia sp. Root335]KQV30567.1 uracil-DNA glycosylase [Massilia sp. Root335]